MKSYWLVIHQQGRTAGHFGTTEEAALEDVYIVRSLFGLAGGYWHDLLIPDNERRILESMPKGLRILPREKCYQSVTSAM